MRSCTVVLLVASLIGACTSVAPELDTQTDPEITDFVARRANVVRSASTPTELKAARSRGRVAAIVDGQAKPSPSSLEAISIALDSSLDAHALDGSFDARALVVGLLSKRSPGYVNRQILLMLHQSLVTTDAGASVRQILQSIHEERFSASHQESRGTGTALRFVRGELVAFWVAMLVIALGPHRLVARARRERVASAEQTRVAGVALAGISTVELIGLDRRRIAVGVFVLALVFVLGGFANAIAPRVADRFATIENGLIDPLPLQRKYYDKFGMFYLECRSKELVDALQRHTIDAGTAALRLQALEAEVDARTQVNKSLEYTELPPRTYIDTVHKNIVMSLDIRNYNVVERLPCSLAVEEPLDVTHTGARAVGWQLGRSRELLECSQAHCDADLDRLRRR